MFDTLTCRGGDDVTRLRHAVLRELARCAVVHARCAGSRYHQFWLATKHAEPFRNISGDETRETKVAHYILGPFLRGVKGGGRGPSVWARVCHDATRDTRFPPWTGRCVGRKAPLALKTGHPNMLGPEAI